MRNRLLLENDRPERDWRWLFAARGCARPTGRVLLAVYMWQFAAYIGHCGLFVFWNSYEQPNLCGTAFILQGFFTLLP